MLSAQDIESGLDFYLERVAPAMLNQGYHLKLVKGGPDYPHLPEQSHFTHIINGALGLSRLIRFLVTHQAPIQGLDEPMFRKALAAYTIHEVHKDGSVELLGSSEFSIPLERLREEYKRLGLDQFVDMDEHLMRAANVHKRSSKHGDLLMSDDPSAARLWLWVRLADTLASVKTPEEAVDSLRGYLADLGPAFAPQSPPGRYALYYHQIKDVRGMLTNAIHRAVAEQLATDAGFFPLLYFATGVLYLGPVQLKTAGGDSFVADVAGRVLRVLTDGSGTGAARDGLRRQKFDFEPYVYAFAEVESLLEVVREETITAKPDPKVAFDEINELVAKRKDLPADWRDTVLDLSAALWVVNEHLQRHLEYRKQKDQRISERLGVLNTSPLAGATFYKEYGRLNDGQSPFPTLTTACQVLLELQGGEAMDLVELEFRQNLGGSALEQNCPLVDTWGCENSNIYQREH